MSDRYQEVSPRAPTSLARWLQFWRLIFLMLFFGGNSWGDGQTQRYQKEVDHEVDTTFFQTQDYLLWDVIRDKSDGELKAYLSSPSSAQFLEYAKKEGSLTNILDHGGLIWMAHNEGGHNYPLATRALTFHHREYRMILKFDLSKVTGEWKYTNMAVLAVHEVEDEDEDELDASKAEVLEVEVRTLLVGDNVQLRRHLGKVAQLMNYYRKQGRPTRAIDLLRRMLQVNADDTEYQVMLAEMLRDVGQMDEATAVVSRVCHAVESTNLAARTEALLPAWSAAGGTAILWNARAAPEDGVRITLVAMGEAPYVVHREFADRLNRLLGVPVRLHDKTLALGPASRSSADDWLERQYDRVAKYSSDNQWAVLGLDIDPRASAELIVEQKLGALEALFRVQGPEGEQGWERFQAKLNRLRTKVQYNVAEIIPELLKNYPAAPHELVIGVVSGDLYGEGNNFLFGNAASPYGVISYQRYTAAFNDEGENRARLVARMLKSGAWVSFAASRLPACSTPHCMRTYVHSLTEVDDNSPDLCEVCLDQWRKHVEAGMSR